MAKNVLITAVLPLFMALLAGCSAGKPFLSTIRGNYAFQQGKFAESTLHYLSVVKNKDYAPWTAYNLGNVYHALGESEAAIEVWDQCRDVQDADLLFRVHFNRGTLYYESGRYRDAYDEFRTALEIDNGNMDARINLELSLKKIQAQAGAAGAGTRGKVSGGGEEKNETRRILEYVRRKEEDRLTGTVQPVDGTKERDW